MICNKHTLCVSCPHRHCIDEEEMYRRLIEDTRYQVEHLGLHWINIWFEQDDTVALNAFFRYREWLKSYGFDGGKPSYKRWIAYREDTQEPARCCGCHSGTFNFHPIR